MEVDTGAAQSIISEETRKAVLPNEKLYPSDINLKTYTDERMIVKGTMNVRVEYKGQNEKLVLVVVDGDGPSLLGRNWLKYICLDWKGIFAVKTVQMKPLRMLLQRYQEILSKDLENSPLFSLIEN